MKWVSISSPVTSNGSNPSKTVPYMAWGTFKIDLSLSASLETRAFLFSYVSWPPWSSLNNISLILLGNPLMAPKFPCIRDKSSAKDRAFMILMKTGRLDSSLALASSDPGTKLPIGSLKF
jgi:hypothetical protein